MVEGVVEGGGRRPGQRGEAQHGRLHVLHPGHRGVSDLVSQSRRSLLLVEGAFILKTLLRHKTLC